MNNKIQWTLAALAAVLVAGCATGPGVAELNDLARQIAKASFRDEGIVKADKVLNTDETNRLCSEADVAGKPLAEDVAKRVEEMNLKTIQWPADGRFLGDWKQGEAIAQSGRGLTFTDSATMVNGGNCYNCHQITKEEISFGTIGPSLLNFGKLRGNSEAIQQYTYGKIWNSQAYSACSNMPRFGHGGILTEQQITHLVALLLDPASPVNQ